MIYNKLWINYHSIRKLLNYANFLKSILIKNNHCCLEKCN
jgi:hypothetical protein